MTDATYVAVMFGIYLTGAIALLALVVHGEWSWRREFKEPLPSDMRWSGWSLVVLLFGVAFAFGHLL